MANRAEPGPSRRQAASKTVEVLQIVASREFAGKAQMWGTGILRADGYPAARAIKSHDLI